MVIMLKRSEASQGRVALVAPGFSGFGPHFFILTYTFEF
jgi:hypothetical protein